MKIAHHEIACGNNPFLIAEAGISHQGDIATAFRMIREAAAAGVDACKFQTYRTADFCRPDDPMYATFEQCEFPDSAWPLLKKMCDDAGVTFLSTPQNPRDLDVLLAVEIPAIKIGSDDSNNPEMLRYCADVGLPTILSTGMSSSDEIKSATWHFGNALGTRQRCELALLVCTSQYPCAASEANLSRLSLLRHDTALPIGFSDHTIGNTASIAATALGACIIEKHFTLDHSLPGPDHSWSMDPNEMRAWVSAVRETHEMMGDGIIQPSEKEMEQKRKYQRTHCGLRGVA